MALQSKTIGWNNQIQIKENEKQYAQYDLDHICHKVKTKFRIIQNLMLC